MTTTPTVWKTAVRENDSVLLAQTHSRVTGLTNGNYLVSWTDNNQIPGPGLETDILGALYDPEGNLLRNDFLLNQNYQVDDEGKQSIGVMSGGKFVVVFEDQNASGVSIRAQGLDENGDDLFIKTILADPGAPVLSNISVAVRSDDRLLPISKPMARIIRCGPLKSATHKLSAHRQLYGPTQHPAAMGQTRATRTAPR